MNDSASSKQKWENQIAHLWPALKGSLAKVYKPCIRKNCPACARGDKHPAWILSYSDQGRRRTLYVPLALVTQLKQAMRNGRKIEKLLHEAGPNLIKTYRKTSKK
jgi:hypothetical protein